jgi:hypothetical protein
MFPFVTANSCPPSDNPLFAVSIPSTRLPLLSRYERILTFKNVFLNTLKISLDGKQQICAPLHVTLQQSLFLASFPLAHFLWR